MLEKTFIHAPGVGPTTERRLWASGIRTWSDFLDGHQDVRLTRTKRESLLDTVETSKKKLAKEDCGYFAQRLPRKEHWRMYRAFKDKTAFLDIETTGLGLHDDITLIGLYDGKHMRTYTLGSDLEEFPARLQRYGLLVTFNGTCFDLPFIQSRFPDLVLDQAHIDLRFALRRLGLSGGLKSIEEQLGLERSESTKGLTGWDAVRLWREYQRGKEESLDLLVEYNAEDVMNMETLLERAYPDLIKTTLSPGPK